MKIITGTSEICIFMSRSDLALASSGYVKYELDAVGNPAIIVSVVDHQEELAKAFIEKEGCAEYLGDIRPYRFGKSCPSS